MLSKFIKALHDVDPELTYEDIADILWLSLYTKSSTSSFKSKEGARESEADTTQSNESEKLLSESEEVARPEPVPQPSLATTPPGPTHSSLHLYAQDGKGLKHTYSGSLYFRTPAVSALPGSLDLGRALRPLMRRIASRTTFVLDEEVTAQHTAEGLLAGQHTLIPVLHPAPERWLELALVVDESRSMHIWRQTIVEFKRLLEHLGAFRDVRTWGLVMGADSKLRIRPGWIKTGNSQLRNPSELIEPEGRRLILVVSDCVSSIWYNNSVSKLLANWSHSDPLAIVQVLPQRLWSRSVLGEAVEVQLRAELPGIPNIELDYEPLSYLIEKGELKGQIPVPVVALKRESLEGWVQAAVIAANSSTAGYMLGTTTERPELEELTISLTPKQRVQRFSTTASPMARSLAELLAVAPITLPVIRLIQHTILPKSDLGHVAEVLLGGLLEELPRQGHSVDPNAVEFDFAEGIRDLLIDGMPKSKSIQVLVKISDFVQSRMGKSLDIRALLADPTSTSGITIDETSRPFAVVATKVLRRLGGDYRVLAERLETMMLPSPQELYAITQDVTEQHYSEVDQRSNEEPASELSTSRLGGNKEVAAPEDGQCTFPSISGDFILLDPKTQQGLEEQLELVGLSAGLAPPFPQYSGRDFLRGGEAVISWYALHNRFDVERDIAERLKANVADLLQERKIGLVKLFHHPGAGGTTVARRILWDFHKVYPSVVLHRYTPETAERLYTIASLTGLCVLLLIDGAQIVDGQVDELYSQLHMRQIPVVLFHVSRFLGETTERSGNIGRNYLSTELSPSEAQRFVEVLSHWVPEKRPDLERLILSKKERERSAFYFCLTTFGHDFHGLERYVGSRLADLTPLQKKILVFLAIAHHYAQRPIRGGAFAELLESSRNHRMQLVQVLPPFARELLMEEQQDTWRTVHDFIALEMLQRLLQIDSKREQWTMNLASWGKEFARFCRDITAIPGEEMLDLVRRAFIYRDTADLLGTEQSTSKLFSHFIEDIPTIEGRAEVLRTVVELFPNEAHFWAHLGRFYATVMSDFQHSLECVERAIALQPNDHVLHHMQGMVLRSQVYRLLGRKTLLNEVARVLRLACDSFERARKLDPNDLYAYISEVELLLRVLDSVRKLEPNRDLYTYMLSTDADPFLRESLGRAEELLDQVQRMRQGEPASSYESQCRARLAHLYGKYEESLRTWEILLHRSDVHHPSIRRQIVWAYLARNGGAWDELNARTIDRIVALLEANLQEERISDIDLSLWIRAVRRLEQPPSIESVIEHVKYWSANSEILEFTYYLYVFRVLQVLEGSLSTSFEAQDYLEKCRFMTRSSPSRTKCLEWMGTGSGINRLVSHTELGKWPKENNFWENTERLARVRGRIVRYIGPQAGQIEIAGSNFNAFFVPAHGIVSDSSPVHRQFDSSDVNKPVDFYLGFSYVGLRAWQVKEANPVWKIEAADKFETSERKPYIFWPGEDDRAVVGEMLRNSSSERWYECHEFVKRLVWVQAKNIPKDLWEDIVQETMIRVDKFLPTFHFQCSLRTWLFGIVRSCIIDAHRQFTRAGQFAAPIGESHDEAEREDDVLTVNMLGTIEVTDNTHDELERALTALQEYVSTHANPIRNGRILDMVIFEGRSLNEAAKAVGCSAAVAGYVVRSAQRYTREKLGYHR